MAHPADLASDGPECPQDCGMCNSGMFRQCRSEQRDQYLQEQLQENLGLAQKFAVIRAPGSNPNRPIQILGGHHRDVVVGEFSNTNQKQDAVAAAMAFQHIPTSPANIQATRAWVDAQVKAQWKGQLGRCDCGAILDLCAQLHTCPQCQQELILGFTPGQGAGQ